MNLIKTFFSFFFFLIFKKEQGRPSSYTLVAHLSVADYASISLNILENAWANCSDYARALKICLIILYIWQAFESASGRECARVLNMTWLYMQWLQRLLNVWIWLNMPQCLNMPQYALMSLKMPENAWILMNISEYAWECLNKLFWLNLVSQYASSS